MAGGWSTALEQALLDHVYGATVYTPPTSLFIALSTAAFDRSATGAACNEVSNSGTGYDRVELTNDPTNFPNATGGDPASKTIGVDVTFPLATADWGTILSYYIIDDVYGAGTVVGGGDAVTPYPVTSGTTPVIQANTAVLSEQ